jgi:hypothetical protein
MPGDDSGVKIPFHQKLAVGAVAGIIGTSCIFPIDVVKTRLQNQVPDPKTGRLPYRGVAHAFRTIIAKESFLGMYKGLGANLVGVSPEKAIKLGANDLFRELLTDESTGVLTLPNQILAGAAAGFCQVSATNPMEIVKLRMQLQNLKPAAERLSTMQVVRGLGLTGLYRGVFVTWMRDVPYSMIFFPGYAVIKDQLSDEHGHAGIGSIIAAGGLAGMSAAWACTPADVIKTRLQAEGARERYSGMVDCFRKTTGQEGFGALFKGSIPRMTVTAPLFSIALLAFELQKRYIKGEPLL